MIEMSSAKANNQITQYDKKIVSLNQKVEARTHTKKRGVSQKPDE